MRLIDKSGEIKNIDYLAGVYTDFDEKTASSTGIRI